MIAGRKTILCAELDSRMEANNEASRKLKILHRTDKFLFEERGSKDLYLGWPFVHGKFMDGTVVRCPLLYFPAELALEEGQWILRQREDVDITFNKSFLLAYAYYNKTQPVETLLEEDFDEADRESTVFRTTLYQLLQKNNLEINFNPDNYRDELISFATVSKDEFVKTHGDGQLKLFPEAVLGIFPQAGSSLVPDYLDLINNEKFTDLEDFFAKRNTGEIPTENNFLQDVREEKVYSVFPMDAWQENALKGSKLGHSLVVQGPPGTGKSQLICNLISDMIANEKRVLVVCQKRVAIDVVYNRLREKRLDDFVALVHDFRDDRKALYEKAARQIERIDEYKIKNNSLDSIQLERKFFDVSRRIDHVCEELENFRKFLFDDSESGKSIKEMYIASDMSQPAIELKQDLIHLHWRDVDAFRRRLRTYARLASRFLEENYPWRVRKSFSELTVKDLKALRNTVTGIHPWFANLQQQIAALLGNPLDWEQTELFIERESLIRELTEIISDDRIFESFQHIINEAEADTSSLWLANIEKMMKECFDAEGPELTVTTPQLGQFQQALDRSMQSRSGLIGLVRWELFSKDKFLITRILVANQLKSNRDGFKTLERKLDRRLNLEHNLSKLRAQPWITKLPDYQTTLGLTSWFDFQQDAILAKSHYLALRGLNVLVNPQQFKKQELIDILTNLRQLLLTVPQKMEEWKKYLMQGQIRNLAENPALGAILDKALTDDFDALVDFDRLGETIQPHEKRVIDKLSDVHNDWDEGDFDSTFVNSLCLAWIDHIELKHPELRIVSTGRIEELEAELTDLLTEKESIGAEIMLLRARERMLDNLEFNRLNNRVTYRDLDHQLTKKKKIWPIRKVVNEYENELMRLLPCWMASPESVSSIFPMREIFDLVIFDEASQCFAERGIPALYRGRQVLIAGDRQQLQPSDLYQARWEEDGDEDPDLEATSLLDLGGRYLKEVSLNGHYRSQLPELIQFSNHHFYKGKLRLLPNRDKINEKFSAIQFIKVNGQWKDNRNEIEAQSVANIVKEQSLLYPAKEIGVITFNAPQQELILDLLEKVAAESNWKIPSGLFVKNIENVQGDERDVIIFSIGYAKDSKGKVNSQFGSLNLSGGENRLNVAVTRAKEKVIVVSSVEAKDLNVGETANRGPKLLKAYLEYAQESSSRIGPAQGYGLDRHSESWYLKRVLRNELPFDFSLEGNLPFCDFIVKRDGQYTLLLLTDDDHYFESPSAKSSHGLVPRVLTQKNWKYKMLYSRNHWVNREKFWHEIMKGAQ